LGGHGYIEAWALSILAATSTNEKLDPSQPPYEWDERFDLCRTVGSAPRDIRPGRPPECRVVTRSSRKITDGLLRTPHGRAELFHTFLHHEVQAAELMAWALLAFFDAPLAFRRGLLRLVLDELRHARMYRAYILDLGFDYGSFPVRDWFWERVPQVTTPAAFVAVMGMGFEAGNLDHAARFTHRLRAAGDATGAELQARIGLEELEHVRFGIHWWNEFRGSIRFDDWAEHLPSPLSPWVMKGRPVARTARADAGFPSPFVDALEAYHPCERSGS
jgi:uncharacterized ferritin-like protein (DUF455 family)